MKSLFRNAAQLDVPLDDAVEAEAVERSQGATGFVQDREPHALRPVGWQRDTG